MRLFGAPRMQDKEGDRGREHRAAERNLRKPWLVAIEQAAPSWLLRVRDFFVGEPLLHAGPQAARWIEGRQRAQAIAQRRFVARHATACLARAQMAANCTAAIVGELAVEICRE